MQSAYQPLLGAVAKPQFKWKCNEQLCSVSSKPVLLILTWNFLVSFAVALFTSPNFYNLIISTNDINLIKVLTFGLSGFLLLFYPLATCLADQKWGRYKTIVNSLYWLLCTATIMCAFGGALIAILVKHVGSQILYTVLGVLILESFLLTLPSLIIFKANVIQFGADQLYDQPSDIKTVYSYRYVWSSYAGTAILQILLSFPLSMTAMRVPKLTTLLILAPFLIFFILGVTLILQYCKHHWFNNERIDYNHCKLVYQVSSYAIKHKDRYELQYTSLQYCHSESTDPIPTTFDVGKERYGGPFTNGQVEDVKIFLKIMRVLLALGPIFAVDIAASNQLPTVAYHLAGDFNTALLLPIKEAYSKTLALNGSLTSLIITFIIPFYICLLRPCIDEYIPRTLKRVGLGMILILLSLITTLLLDTAEHVHLSRTTCYLVDDHHLMNNISHTEESSSISPLYIMIPYTLNAFAYMLLYIGVYQFILSQSPYRMRGLVIGSYFAIKGIFQLLAVLTVYLPFISWSSNSSFPSCGFVYYLINITIALIGIVVYTWAAANYQYKEQEGEPPNEHNIDNRFSKDEPVSGYNNYSNSKHSRVASAAQKGKSLENKAKHSVTQKVNDGSSKYKVNPPTTRKFNGESLKDKAKHSAAQKVNDESSKYKAKPSTTRKFNNESLKDKAKHSAAQKRQSLEYTVKRCVAQKHQSLEYKVEHDKNCVHTEPVRSKNDPYLSTPCESDTYRDSSLRRPHHRRVRNKSLIYRVEDDNGIHTYLETDKKDANFSTPQATNAHDQESATGNNREVRIQLPDHISSRNKSEQ